MKSSKHLLTQIPGLQLGVVISVTAEGRPRVRWADQESVAEAIELDGATDWRRAVGRQVVLGFVATDGGPKRPVVLGLLEGPAGGAAKAEESFVDAVRRGTAKANSAQPDAAVAADSPGSEPQPLAPFTPRKLRFESHEEIELICGKSRILLQADGRVLIRGEHVLSRSAGPNKIKGASVQIN